MAIVIDKPNIGNASNDTTATSIAFTTTQTVAAGGFIVVAVTFGSATVTVTSLSDGTLTWAKDKEIHGGTGNSGVSIWSAQAPSGLASGATITANFSSTVVGRGICGTSFTGVATSSPLDTTSGNTDFVTTTAWTTASTAIKGGSVLVGAYHDASQTSTSTITGPSVEAQDFGPGGATFCQGVGYRIEAGAGSFTVAGTLTNADTGTVAAVAYLVAAGGAAATVVPPQHLGFGVIQSGVTGG